MKVIVIGASGTIGREVVKALRRHEVVEVSRNHGQFRADLTDKSTLESLFQQTSPFDAVVSCAGSAAFKPLLELTDEDFLFSLRDKLMGQVNVVRTAASHMSEGGSITLTSGVLAQQPMPGASAISLVNAGLEGFVRGAALELGQKGIRVNVVSPPWVTETLIALNMDPSHGIPSEKVAKAYVESVENGARTGEVLLAEHFRDG